MSRKLWAEAACKVVSLTLTLWRPEDGVEDVLDGVVVGAEVVRRLRAREAAEGEGQREGHDDDDDRDAGGERETKDKVRGSDFDAASSPPQGGRFGRRWRR